MSEHPLPTGSASSELVAEHRQVGASPAPEGLQILPVNGLPEFRPGDDLAGAIADAAPWLVDGDVLVVTSKVLSKTEGRLVASPTDPDERDTFRRSLIDDETVRLVAQLGRTKIVENRLGLIAAAAGIDGSNVHSDEIALLPEDPDGSAAALVAAFAQRGVRVGVLITDTQGRAWRGGVTDVAIGGAGVGVLDDHRGGIDEHGNELVVTQVAIGDELAAAADLVKGKLSGVPVAVVRGLDAPGGQTHPGGGRQLIRPYEQDLFRLGTDLALAQGRQQSVRSAALDIVLSADEPDPEHVLHVLRSLRTLLPDTVAGGVELRVSPGDPLWAVAIVDCDHPAATAVGGAMALAGRAGAAMQALRGLLAADGIGSNWIVPTPQFDDLPDKRAVIAAIDIRMPHPDTALAEVSRTADRRPPVGGETR